MVSLKILRHRVTKSGNDAFATALGEIYLNPDDEKCVGHFVKYFPDGEDEIRKILMLRNYVNKLIGKTCVVRIVLEPL